MKTLTIALLSFVTAVSLLAQGPDTVGIVFTKASNTPNTGSVSYQVWIGPTPSTYTTSYVFTVSAPVVTNWVPVSSFSLGTNYITVRLSSGGGTNVIVSDQAKAVFIRTSEPSIQIIGLSLISRLPGQPWQQTPGALLPDITALKRDPKEEFAVVYTLK